MYAPRRLALLALLAVALPAQAQHRSHRSRGDQRDGSTFRLDTTVALSRSGTLSLESFSADVSVIGWDRDQIQIHATTSGSLHFDATSSHVSLSENPADGDYNEDDNDGRVDIQISMPKSARLTLRTMSGDIKLQNVSDVEAHSVSGDLTASNISSHAVLETVSGDLNVDHVAAGLRANTISGDIKSRSVTGEVAAQSVSGDIVLDDVTSSYVHSETVSGTMHFTGPVDPKGRYEFHSHSGDIDLDLRGGGSDASLDVETFSGDLDSPCAMTLQPGGRGDRTGKRGTFTFGKGGGAHFILKTFSGDVHISGCRSHGDQ